MSVVQEYKCPCCGAGLKFSSGSQQLHCEYCENTFDLDAVQAYNDTQSKESFDWENYDASSGSGNWSQEERQKMQVFLCPSCSGQLITEATTAATFCPYCGNPAIIPSRLEDSFRPDLVIPFQKTKEDAQSAFLAFCRGKRLLPKGYVNTQRLEQISGVYVPFWVFDCGVDASMRYRATRIQHWSDSRYSYTKTDHFLLQRQGSLQCSGIPVDASRKMENSLMESIEPFDYSKAVPFDTAYLSGYLADQYDVTSQDCQPIANDRVLTSAEELFTATTAGYATVLPESRSIQVQAGKVRYMLLPVWILQSTYGGKTYTFAMNGQTGKLVGNLPMSASRAWAWFGGICGGVAATYTLLSLLAQLL